MINTDSRDFEILVQVPDVHACYVDHFPGNPLVPGALLLKWIMAAIENHAQCNLNLIKQIKFLAVVKPADQLRILVNIHPENTHFAVSVFVGDICVIKGVMQVELAANLVESGND